MIALKISLFVSELNDAIPNNRVYVKKISSL